MFGFLLLLSVFLICKCEENVTEICKHNFIDAILDYGFEYIVIQNDLISDYNTNTKQFENIQVLANDETRYQSTFVTYSNDNDNCNANLSVECLRTDKSLITSTAYDVKSGEQYYLSMNYDLFLETIVKNKQLITFNKLDVFDENEKNSDLPTFLGYKHQKYKPSTYWPKHQLSIFIFNANKTMFDTRKAILATKTRNSNKWEYNYIFGSENLIYSSLFWWRNTDQVYAVIQSRNNRNNGYVYRFKHENLDTPFETTNQSVMEFFNCPPKPQKHKPIVLLIIIIVLVVIISIAIMIATYLYLNQSKDDTTNSNANMYSDNTSTFTTNDSIHTIDSFTGQRIH